MRPFIAATASLPRAVSFERQRLASSLLQTPLRFSRKSAAISSTSTSSRCFSLTSARLSEERQWSTPLAKQLYEAISTTGSVPLASYMRMCLTGDLGGYYTGAVGQDRDQFGAKGDFVTSPEISQIFGELLGIWFIAEWISQGLPSKGVQLIEVGPGRGTLMDDMLRTIQRFPAMAASIESVFMVEASRELRETQKKRLCGPDAPSTESNAGCHSPSKYGATPIVWTETIKSIPIESDKTPFIVAHEFFDALPIHTFQSAPAPAPAASKTSPPSSPSPPSSSPSSRPDTTASTLTPAMEWREMMVSITPPRLILILIPILNFTPSRIPTRPLLLHHPPLPPPPRILPPLPRPQTDPQRPHRNLPRRLPLRCRLRLPHRRLPQTPQAGPLRRRPHPRLRHRRHRPRKLPPRHPPAPPRQPLCRAGPRRSQRRRRLPRHCRGGHHGQRRNRGPRSHLPG
ncbi:uncharacterized protein TrAtP1_009930 [Trichoderma atroviride]|uniref:uncharacterized protein n=1 Tax=Hypocrea atroviridis TaxID=63577 RepID=UPI003321A1B6|nr:hypothetical protein TrAtP1_009930 [Trichoderma atroviride]